GLLAFSACWVLASRPVSSVEDEEDGALPQPTATRIETSAILDLMVHPPCKSNGRIRYRDVAQYCEPVLDHPIFRMLCNQFELSCLRRIQNSTPCRPRPARKPITPSEVRVNFSTS